MKRIARAARSALAWVGALFLISAVLPIGSWLASKMSTGWDDQSADVLVVLGGSMLVPGTGPNATMGGDTFLRCVYAGWVLRTTSYRYVIVSGNDGLAAAMQKWLEFQGTHGARIVQENAAASTWENAVYSRNLIRRLFREHAPSVTILTSDYHSWRAKRIFEKAGLQARCIAIPDAVKSAMGWRQHIVGTMTVSEELLKDLYYFATGKL